MNIENIIPIDTVISLLTLRNLFVVYLITVSISLLSTVYYTARLKLLSKKYGFGIKMNTNLVMTWCYSTSPLFNIRYAYNTLVLNKSDFLFDLLGIVQMSFNPEELRDSDNYKRLFNDVRNSGVFKIDLGE